MGEARSGREASVRQIRLGVTFLEGPETCQVTGVLVGESPKLGLRS